ncbi:PREDICTED: WD repeat-containing protein 55 [Thamnophis sirtalis]|uniref:WD repeat-containing protein 55 n=1 Tax=Thamnophis sirtalis TaxID=35019 RepID=A0A6I9YJ32_9SAUR|nr:PREDICTED: WD repeat-containing protein 55 [Thamnophis sirtalis]
MHTCMCARINVLNSIYLYKELKRCIVLGAFDKKIGKNYRKQEHSDEKELGLEPRLHDTPEDIFLEAAANTIDFHPSRDIIAIGDVDGDVYVYSYSCLEGENKELWSSGHHLKSCRKISFSQDGQRLFTVSKDKSIHILNVEEGRLVTRFSKAHNSALNSLLVIDEHLFATGDDSGMLKLWDLRKGTSIMEMKQHEDYISDMILDRNKKLLLTTSGDGTMGVFNIRRRRFELLSEPQNGDLMAISLMKLCSSGGGESPGQGIAAGSSRCTGGKEKEVGWQQEPPRLSPRAFVLDAMALALQHCPTALTIHPSCATEGTFPALVMANYWQ